LVFVLQKFSFFIRGFFVKKAIFCLYKKAVSVAKNIITHAKNRFSAPLFPIYPV
jgi:hypothetical protein